MNILNIDYTLSQKSLDIYIAGCKGNPHCSGCHNPESWDFNKGVKYDDNYLNYIKDKMANHNNLIENIMIFGGEPLDQDLDELYKFLLDMTSFNKNIWLFTRYEINSVPRKIYKSCQYIKCGRYNQNLKCENNIQYGIKLATSNQVIYKINK